MITIVRVEKLGFKPDDPSIKYAVDITLYELAQKQLG